MMVRGVSSDKQDLKVRQSVVVLDFVSVVDVLISAQLSAKMSLHDLTVLKHEAIAVTNSDVAVRADKAARVLDCSSAVHRAEAHTASNSLRLNPKLFSATFAGNSDHS